MQKVMQKALRVLKADDLKLLQYLYLYRTLTLEQAFSLIYHLTAAQARKRSAVLKRLLDVQVIELVEYLPQTHALFLTTLGINIVRQTKEIPQEIFDEDAQVVKRGYYRASELKMRKTLINHQVTKNDFFFKFRQLINSPAFQAELKQLHIPLHYQYFDEKYLTAYVLMRPDAVLHIGDTDFFIEEDMATESSRQLIEKWNHYRMFMETAEFYNRENRIVVLFLTDNITKPKNIQKRQHLVQYTLITSLLDKIKTGFDVYIGTQTEILQAMPQIIKNLYFKGEKEQVLLPVLQNLGFKVSSAFNLLAYTNQEEYDYYIRQSDPQQNLLLVNQRAQEFFVDLMPENFSSLAIWHKIQFHRNNDYLFRKHFGRPLQYLLVIHPQQESTLWQNLQLLKAGDDANLFFTTIERLQTQLLPQALFRFDQRGVKYHFYDAELVRRIYEE